ncbi:hypothetical protein MH215_12735 [Paenibacillus sp. ACRSA]|nr:hypothetical protein [Paenibacillus sp. ACRSA]MCG7377863.1 hypothetical protein [Paenibacillus sp. ACRSA]
MTEVTRVELIEWVRKLMNAEGTEAELDEMLSELQQQVTLCRDQQSHLLG